MIQLRIMSNCVPAIVTIAVFVVLTLVVIGHPESASGGTAPRRPATQPVIQALPSTRGGQDLIGEAMPPLRFERWINTPGDRPPEFSHSVVLYRWCQMLDQAIQAPLR